LKTVEARYENGNDQLNLERDAKVISSSKIEMKKKRWNRKRDEE